MRRTVVRVVVVAAVAFSLTGCGGSSPYCEAVEKDASMLNTFGKTRSEAGYTAYATVLGDIAKVAPTDVQKDWEALAEATAGVTAAQKKAGLKLEDMADKAKVKKLTPDQLSALNKAYKAFNGTTAQRTSVVKNVLQECEITLK